MLITVINRKEFLHEAINSVFHQSIDRSLFEVVVVSNFKVEVSNFPQDFRITTLLMEGTLGERLYAGIKSAKYEIIAFLDDDDTFNQEKLQRVIEVFSEHPKLCYYHNNQRYVDRYLKHIDYVRLVEKRTQLLKDSSLLIDVQTNLSAIKEAIEMRGDFNLSSIAVKREDFMEYLPLLKQIDGLSDGFFFWISLVNMGQIMIDSQKLTNYRLHELNTSGQTNFFNKIIWLEKEICTFNIILNFMDNRHLPNNVYVNLKGSISLHKYEYLLLMYIFGNTSRVTTIKGIAMVLFFGRGQSHTLKHRVILFALIRIVSSKLAKNLYQKIRKNNYPNSAE